MLLLLPRSARSGAGGLLAVCACWLLFVGVSASLPGNSRCPHLLCANEGRHFCRAGSAHCGSCLSPLVENASGRCVTRHKKPKHHRQRVGGDIAAQQESQGAETFPMLEQEIDFLHSVLEEKVTVVRPDQSTERVNASLRDDKKISLDAVLPVRPTAAAPPNATTPAGTPAAPPGATAVGDGRAGPKVAPVSSTIDDSLIIILITLSIVVGTVFMVTAAVCFVRMRRGSHLAQKADYPGFRGPVTANGSSLGDSTLQMSAQMYHYQHQRQQILSLGKAPSPPPGTRGPQRDQKASDPTWDEEEIGGDFTVYECPGLAPTGEMEVKNPLFDDSTLQYQGNLK